MTSEREFKPVIWSVVAAVLVISGLALLGWLFDVQFLKSVRGDWTTMRVATALCLAGCAAALAALQPSGERRRNHRVSRIIGVGVALLGLVSLLAYLWALLSGLEPLWTDAALLRAFFNLPSRMAPVTALIFIGFGSAIFLLSSPRPRAAGLAHAIVLPVALLSYLVLISYLFGMNSLHTWMQVPVALNTCLACCALSIGLFFVRPGTWFMRVLLSPETGGSIARLLLPAVLTVPVLIGWVRFASERAGLITPPIGAPLAVIANALVMLWVLWLVARSATLTDERRRKVEATLLESEERFRTLAGATFEGIALTEYGRLTDANERFCQLIGYDLSELMGMEVGSIVAPEDRQRVMDNILHGRESFIEHGVVRKDGTRRTVEVHGRDATYRGRSVRITAVRDITERRKMEQALAITIDRLELAQRASGSGTWDWDVVTSHVEWSPRMFELLGLNPANTVASFVAWNTALHPEDKEAAAARIEEALRKHTPLDSEYRVVHPDGQTRWISAIGKGVYDENDQPVRMAGLCMDITDRKRAEEELRRSEERYRLLFDTLIEGFCIIEVVFDADDRPVDYRFLEVNPAFEAQSGLVNARGRLVRELAPGLEAHWFEDLGRVALTGQPARFVNEARALNRWYDVSAYRLGGPESRRVAVLFNDVADRKRAEERILQLYQEASAEITRRRQVEMELRRSNADLEQFAFAISHDLRSPLNAITSFAKQLDEEYHEKLGADADTYLTYITGASARLRRLISDLLVYSRVAEVEQSNGTLRDSQEALRAAELNLQERIREAGAVITYGPLPEVIAPAGLLTQVFQNLVENAIKFRGEAAPRIHVSAERRGDECLFCVTDNGIGIDPQHLEQVFRIFKRLHGDTYEGTGIGLAVCKKIVERQGGRIWVESSPGQGAKFCFTLPVPARPRQTGATAGE